MTSNTIALFQEAEKFGMYLIGRRRPNVFKAFLNVAHEVMQPASALTQLERELLGAYVSKQFGCGFCHLGHLETALEIGGEEVRHLVDAPSATLLPLYQIADKVVANAVTEQDVAEFLDQGYTEQHYEDVVFVCALFGFANRMVTGMGIEYKAKRDQASSRRLAHGYKMK